MLKQTFDQVQRHEKTSRTCTCVSDMFLQLHGCMSSPSDSESPVWRPMGPCWRLGNRPDCRLIRKSAQESAHASRNLPYLVSRSAHPAQRAVLLTGMESKNGRSRRFYAAPFAGTTAHRWTARVLVDKREDVVPPGPRNETGSLRTLESAVIIRVNITHRKRRYGSITVYRMGLRGDEGSIRASPLA